MADPEFYKPGQVDAILGANAVAQLLTDGMETLKCGLVAHKTLIGYVIFGGMNDQRTCCFLSSQQPVITNEMLHRELKQLWEHNEPQVGRDLKPEDRWVIEEFKARHYRDNSGRYVVTIPIEPNGLERIGETRNIAMRQFLWMERKRVQNPELQEKYNKFMREYEEMDTCRKQSVY